MAFPFVAAAGLALSAYGASQKPPSTPGSVKKLTGQERDIYRQASSSAIDDYIRARQGYISRMNKVNLGQARSSISSLSGEGKRAMLDALSNPDTLISGLHSLRSLHNTSRTAASGTMESNAYGAGIEESMDKAQGNISASEAVRRGYSIQNIQNKGISQMNKFNRQNLIGQGIGGFLSSVGQSQYYNNMQPPQQSPVAVQQQPQNNDFYSQAYSGGVSAMSGSGR